MQTTPRTLSFRPSRRLITWASAVAASSALISVGGCQADSGTGPSDAGSGGGLTTNAGSGGRNGSSGGSASGGAANMSGGSSNASGGSSSGGSSSESGGSSNTNGGSTTGGSGSGSGGTTTGAGGMGTGGKACTDVEPPPDPKWPDANCKKWAAETKECTEDWFKNYCDVSCGRCTPTGGMGGSTGSAGATSRGGASGNSGGSTGTGGGATASGGSGAVDCSTAGLPTVTGGNGWASRYWDCCQTHCAQSNGHRCAQDGVSSTGNNQSACTGGGSFACYDESPKAVNDCLSYGYIAKANPNCGGCFRIQFTGEGQHDAKDPGSQLIKGKQMVVKVSNTGGDVASNQFDLMVPGGGVGQFNACSKQWGTSDLGAQYGGFLTNCKGDHAARKECVRQNCSKIPAGPARNGCLWFVDWFQAADNPKFTSQATNCPF